MLTNEEDIFFVVQTGDVPELRLQFLALSCSQFDFDHLMSLYHANPSVLQISKCRLSVALKRARSAKNFHEIRQTLQQFCCSKRETPVIVCRVYSARFSPAFSAKIGHVASPVKKIEVLLKYKLTDAQLGLHSGSTIYSRKGPNSVGGPMVQYWSLSTVKTLFLSQHIDMSPKALSELRSVLKYRVL